MYSVNPGKDIKCGLVFEEFQQISHARGYCFPQYSWWSGYVVAFCFFLSAEAPNHQKKQPGFSGENFSEVDIHRRGGDQVLKKETGLRFHADLNMNFQVE